MVLTGIILKKTTLPILGIYSCNMTQKSISFTILIKNAETPNQRLINQTIFRKFLKVGWLGVWSYSVLIMRRILVFFNLHLRHVLDSKLLFPIVKVVQSRKGIGFQQFYICSNLILVWKSCKLLFRFYCHIIFHITFWSCKCYSLLLPNFST